MSSSTSCVYLRNMYQRVSAMQPCSRSFITHISSKSKPLRLYSSLARTVSYHNPSNLFSLIESRFIHRYSVLPNRVNVSSVEIKPSVQTATEILSNLSPDEAKKLKVLRLEYDVFFSSGIRVPDKVTDEEWLLLLREHASVSSRKNFYAYLFKKEKATLNDKVKKVKRLEIHEERKRVKLESIAAQGSDSIGFKNSFMLFLQEATMNQSYQNNLCYSMINGPHLVFDFNYETEMTDEELKNLCNQIMICHGSNKVAREPFHFHFCNVNEGSKTEARLKKSLANVVTWPITITSRDYSECYPKERLVYLSPNAPETMGNTFDVDDVYIIGAIVDRAKEDHLTFAKARKEKLRMVRFPLESHVRWVQGSKSLPLNQVVNIMLEFKTSKNWQQALHNNLPTRKYTKDWN